MWYKISRMAERERTKCMRDLCGNLDARLLECVCVWQQQITYENKMQSLFEFIHNSIRSNYQEQTNVTKIRIDKKKWIILYLLWSELNNEHHKMWKCRGMGTHKRRVGFRYVWCMRCVVYAILSAMSGNWMNIIFL